MIIETKNYKLAAYQSGPTHAAVLVLVLPGFLDTKDYSHMHHHVESLGRAGFQAVSFDPPGTWESGGEISDYTMTNYLKAVNELMAYFNKPTILFGHSMGGMIAMLAAAHGPQVVGVISVMSAHAFIREDNYQERVIRWQKEGVRTSYRDLPNDPSSQRTFILPYSFSQDAQQYDVHNILQNIQCSKLFIAGRDDDIVSLSQVKEIYDAALEPKELQIIESDHDYRWHHELIQKVSQLSVEFASTVT